MLQSESMETEKESSSNVETSKSDQQPESKEEANTDEQTRLWAAVKGKPSDFTSWTSLLQIVEQKVLLYTFYQCACKHDFGGHISNLITGYRTITIQN